MLAEKLIRIWAETEKEVAAATGERKTNYINTFILALIIVTALVLLIAYLVFLMQVNTSDSFVGNVAFVIYAITAVVLAIESRFLVKRRDAHEELYALETRCASVTSAFIQKTRIPASKIDDVKSLVSSLIEEKEERRKTVVGRAYSACVGGIVVSGLAYLVQNIEGYSMTTAAWVVAFCFASIGAACAIGPIWDCNDALKKDSLLRARRMVNGLDCYQLFK